MFTDRGLQANMQAKHADEKEMMQKIRKGGEKWRRRSAIIA